MERWSEGEGGFCSAAFFCSSVGCAQSAVVNIAWSERREDEGEKVNNATRFIISIDAVLRQFDGSQRFRHDAVRQGAPFCRDRGHRGRGQPERGLVRHRQLSLLETARNRPTNGRAHQGLLRQDRTAPRGGRTTPFGVLQILRTRYSRFGYAAFPILPSSSVHHREVVTTLWRRRSFRTRNYIPFVFAILILSLLRGTVRHHQVDPLDYDRCCDAALDLDAILHPNPALQEMIKSIDRSKYRVWALTNAYKNVSRLSLSSMIEGLISDCNSTP